MKRSIINKIIQESDEFIKSYGFRLPPFAYFQPSELVARKLEFQAIFDARLGWDITDYGEGRFNEKGLFLFTVRNGSMSDLRSGKGMCYAEKIMISRQDQVSPSHRHIIKTADMRGTRAGVEGERGVGVGGGGQNAARNTIRQKTHSKKPL